jgi:phosphotransferase system IIB component
MASGFTWVYNLHGGAPTIQTKTIVNAAVMAKGVLCNAESGEVTIGVSADTELLGATVEAVDNTDDGEVIRVIVNPDAVYEVTDANARVTGAHLDINTGALTVTTDSNHDLVVVEDSSASEPTRVRIAAGNHAFD